MILVLSSSHEIVHVMDRNIRAMIIISIYVTYINVHIICVCCLFFFFSPSNANGIHHRCPFGMELLIFNCLTGIGLVGAREHKFIVGQIYKILLQSSNNGISFMSQ